MEVLSTYTGSWIPEVTEIPSKGTGLDATPPWWPQAAKALEGPMENRFQIPFHIDGLAKIQHKPAKNWSTSANSAGWSSLAVAYGTKL